MAGPSSKLPAARKRTRKRKRRVASSSSSSSSSDSDSDSSASDVQRTVTIPVNVKAQKIPIEPSEASSSSSSPSSEDSSDESDSEIELPNAPNADTPGTKIPQEHTKQPKVHRPPSPPPKPVPIPSFLASSDNPEQDKRDEEQLRERFRKFWMATIVDAFSDDLEEIRKEPNMDSSRLAMLIDSLASGADVFSSSASSEARGGEGDINEMEVVLEEKT